MTTPFICVLIAFLLIYVPKLPLSVAMARSSSKGYDNKHPRQQQAALEGFGARSAAAHYNSFEAFAPFVAAVMIAHLTVGPDYRANVLSVAFVVARGLYIAAYLANQDYLRSAIWGVGMLCTVGLMCLPWLS